jgi:hypothetical protein
MVMGAEAESNLGGINMVECLMEDEPDHHGVHTGRPPPQPGVAVSFWDGCGTQVQYG